MGQFYKAIVIDGNETKLYEPEGGAKLTEHSWLGNEFVNWVYSNIEKSPKRVAWIGDYSNMDWNDDEPYANAISPEEFLHYYNIAWSEDDAFPVESAVGLDQDYLYNYVNIDTKERYLVNHSRRLYLDMETYIDKCKVLESGDWWCLSPLPLLAACGNGRGGGDFAEEYEGFENVGIWAFDLLQYSDHHPAEYREVQYTFREVNPSANTSPTRIEISGKNVVIAGAIPGYLHSDLKSVLSKLGATLQASVSSTTDYVVVGSKPGIAKIDAAKRLGIAMLTQAQFRTLVNI